MPWMPKNSPKPKPSSVAASRSAREPNRRDCSATEPHRPPRAPVRAHVREHQAEEQRHHEGQDGRGSTSVRSGVPNSATSQ